MISIADRKRFWVKVNVCGPDECWLWTKGVDDAGYGQFKLQRKNIKAHRVAFIIFNGYTPKNHIRHTCDNPPCCNPAHLVTGSHTQNMKDMLERGRKNTQLSIDQVVEARGLANDGWTLGQMYRRYNVHKLVITNAVRGVTFSFLNDQCAPSDFQSRDKYVSKLSIAQIKEIKRALLTPYWGQGLHLARKYGVESSTIGNIKHGRSHGEVSID